MNIEVSSRQHFFPTLSFMFSSFLLQRRTELAVLPSLCSGHSLMPNAFHFMALHLIAAASVYVPNGSITAFHVLKTGSLQPESRSFQKYLDKLGTIRNILELWGVNRDCIWTENYQLCHRNSRSAARFLLNYKRHTSLAFIISFIYLFFWSSHCL